MTSTVLVTGGNRGIGLACAHALSAAGHQVAVTYRKEPVEGYVSVRCDQTDPAQVDAAVDEVEAQLGPIGVLVANVGITRDGLSLTMSDEAFTEVLDANLVGTFRFARRCARSMLRQKQGRIILVSSVVAAVGSAGQANYAASKAGMIGLGRSLAGELASRSITTNIVTPGFIDTDMTVALPDDRRAQILEQIPLGRLATPAEVAELVVFLASPGAAYINGAVIPVDGGLGMGQ